MLKASINNEYILDLSCFILSTSPKTSEIPQAIACLCQGTVLFSCEKACNI